MGSKSLYHIIPPHLKKAPPWQQLKMEDTGSVGRDRHASINLRVMKTTLQWIAEMSYKEAI